MGNDIQANGKWMAWVYALNNGQSTYCSYLPFYNFYYIFNFIVMKTEESNWCHCGILNLDYTTQQANEGYCVYIYTEQKSPVIHYQR